MDKRYKAEIAIVRGNIIKAVRYMIGLDQRQVAAMLKWTPQKLSAFENGAPINDKSWKALRVLFAKYGASIILSRKVGKVVITGMFVEQEASYYDDEELEELEDFTN